MARDTIKFLHSGDIHLDSPFSRLSAQKSEERRTEMRETFKALLRVAAENAVDLVLIAGDLFDSEYATEQTVKLLYSEFSALPNIKFVISPGNHDPITDGSIYKAGFLPKNVYIFKEEELSRIDFEDIGVCVWGYAFTSQNYERAPLAGRRVGNPGVLNLLCCHCDLDLPLSKTAPVTLNDIEYFGAAYAALGHRHIATDVRMAGDTAYAYCGCAEGRSFDEPGVGGAYLVCAKRTTVGFRCEAKRINLARRRYQTEQIDVTGSGSVEEVNNKISKQIKQRGYGDETALRVILFGAVTPNFVLPRKLDANVFGIYYLEILDRTTPTYDSEYMKNDKTMRGELYRTLLPGLESGSAKERAEAGRALKIGLAALDNRDITII